MPDANLARLIDALRVAPAQLSALAQLDDHEIAAFADAVQHALRTQRDEIDDSLEQALGFIPRPLRGRARKLLFGHGSRIGDG